MGQLQLSWTGNLPIDSVTASTTVHLRHAFTCCKVGDFNMGVSWTWLVFSVNPRLFEKLQFVALSGGFTFQHQRSLLSVNKLPLAIINLKGNEDQSIKIKIKTQSKEWNLYAEVSPLTKLFKGWGILMSAWLKTNLFGAIWKSDADVEPSIHSYSHTQLYPLNFKCALEIHCQFSGNSTHHLWALNEHHHEASVQHLKPMIL